MYRNYNENCQKTIGTLAAFFLRDEFNIRVAIKIYCVCAKVQNCFHYVNNSLKFHVTPLSSGLTSAGDTPKDLELNPSFSKYNS